MAQHLLVCLLLAGFMSCLPGHTFAMQERITLMLTGPACTTSQETIDQALRQTTGVRHIDLQAVPGHILVDIETGTVTATTLEDRVNDVLATPPSCRAEIMKSCISADPRPASTEVR
jgi:hypothetical protein